MPTRWIYEPDEKPKKKHGWHRDEADFVFVDGKKVGKCPKSFSLDLAETLINEGVPYFAPRTSAVYPKRIYVVHEGVLYRAVPTVPGRSYHGFPELASEFNDLPRRLQEEILRHADQRGQLSAVKKWLDHP